jgi:hypothetical protein
MSQNSNGSENVLAETANFLIVEVNQEDDTIYDVDFGIVTVHLTAEEYDEFVELVKQLK